MDPNEESPRLPDDVVSWEEVEDGASNLFRVWFLGSELDWAKECWGHFEKSGLTGSTFRMERTATLLRLVTLAQIYHEFCGLAWGENPDISLNQLADEVDIDPVALGALAASLPADLPLGKALDEEELKESALFAIVASQRREVFACLFAAYKNEVGLYSRMYRTRRAPGEEEEADFDEFRPTYPNSAALNFVMNGFEH